MNALTPDPLVRLSLESLSRLMPMHAIVSTTGHIEHTGQTLAKLAQKGFIGLRFLEAFEMRRPRDITTINDLRSKTGQPLRLRMRQAPNVALNGLALPLPGHGGLLIDLSFGIGAVDAVGRFELTSGDFPPTDLTIEMLYLVEANAAVFAESRNLTMRLLGAKADAEEKAFTDTLTGLRNRRAMDAILKRYAECSDSFALMHLDLDFFKAVNDTLGHAAGDAVLREASRILNEETRVSDTVARVGGDEFVLILTQISNVETVERIGARILQQLEKPIKFGNNICRISGSIGVTLSEDYAQPDPEQMLIDADKALYASKHAGRARITLARNIDLSVPIFNGVIDAGYRAG
jgi:diguanylate cyclase (GGDEF)-like protein